VLSGREKALEGHAQHTAAVFAAASELNWLPGHVYAVHESPGAAWNVPGAHGVHPTPPLPVYPALQTQSETLSLPAAETLWAGHAMHPPVSL